MAKRIKQALVSLNEEVRRCEEMVTYRLEHSRMGKRELEEILQLIEWLEQMRSFVRRQSVPVPTRRQRLAFSLAGLI